MPEPEPNGDQRLGDEIAAQKRVSDELPLSAPTDDLNELDSFEFVYDGPDLGGGSMSAKELAEVLAGLTRAFSIVAHDNDLGDLYELRVKDVESGSFHILFEAIAFVKANPVASTAIAVASQTAWNVVKDTASGAYRVISDIAKAIDAKVALKGERLRTAQTTLTPSGVVLTLAVGSISLTKEQYELLLSGRIDKPLAQIVSPLAHDRVISFEMRSANAESTRVTSAQRDYFDYREMTEVMTKEGTEITGVLNSLTKTSRRGTFHTEDGVHVPYRYTGGDDGLLLRGFSSKEPVKVTGRIKYDAQGTPTSIEVDSIEALQRRFSQG